MKPIFLLLAHWLLSSMATAQGSSASLLTTYTNPTPAFSAIFGASVAGLGSDRVLIGTDQGRAHLFSTSGILLRTFTISDPAAGGFGNLVVGVGNDRVLISAYSYGTTAQNGRAYLFNTNGTLQRTFINPATATVQAFGVSVAALGSDRVIIGGVPDINKPAPYPGGVYLFRTNGTLLATFSNPIPTNAGTFGASASPVGMERVLIGAPDANRGATRAGVAHLFNTNGTWLLTITNPAPVDGDNFGFAVAGVGNDRLLVGAIDDGRVRGGGAAYLFSTNGTLLTTFTNPNPAPGDNFGSSLTAVGGNRVLIGAYGTAAGVVSAGAAYLFTTNGTLLNTFTNPSPATFDDFGYAVASVGTDQVLIGAIFDDTGATDSGSAYLYDLPYPSLSIARNAATVSVKWVTAETGLTLQQTDLLSPPQVWSHTTNAVAITGRTNLVQQNFTNGTTNRFYRLRRP